MLTLPPLAPLRRTGRVLHNLRARLPGPPPRTVVVELEGSLPQRRPPRRLSLLLAGRRETSLEELEQAFHELAADPRVETVHLRLKGLRAGPATLASLRRLIQELGESRRVRLWAESLSFAQAWLASAASELYLPESAELQPWGLRARVVFLKELLDRWGVEAQLERTSDFKTFPDALVDTEMSDALRSTLESLTGSLFETMTSQIAGSRSLAGSEVRGLVDHSPLLPQEARSAGLVDGLAYEDELLDERTPVWPRARRRLRLRTPVAPPPRVAVISLEGTIVPGRSRRLPVPVPLLGTQAGAESLAQALRQAERERRIAAVVLHVESGGGSAAASDLIWREVRRLDRRKPVVAYLGDVAASGGYYVALGARRIVAQPTTVTGSIGVITGKLVLAGLLERLGLRSQAVQQGENAGFAAASQPFTPAQRERLRAHLEESYGRFRERVVEGRRLEGEALERVLGGKVWTGEQALELGLVDELGDLRTAIAGAAGAAGLDPARVGTVNLHPPRHALPPQAWEAERLAGTRLWALLPYQLTIEA